MANPEITVHDLSQYLVDGAEFELGVFTSLAAEDYPTGLVVARVTASGKWTPYNAGGSGGIEVIQGVLGTAVSATAVADHPVSVLVKGLTHDAKTLVWTGGSPVVMSAAQRDELRGVGIIAQSSDDLSGLDNQ